MNRTAQLGRAAVAALIATTGCPYSQIPETPCPEAPAPGDWGPVAPMAGSSSVDIELNRLYVFARVRQMLEGSQAGDAGAFVRSIDLREVPDPATNRPLGTLAIRLEPWVRDQQTGQAVPIGRFYRVTLRITPHLVTPTTVPDQVRRKQLLCPATEPDCPRDEGALLTFDLHQLEPACDPADFVDARIRPRIYQGLARQRPLALPTAPVSTLLDSVTGRRPTLADVNLSADGFLKVGLAYEISGMAGSTHPFDRATQELSRYPGNDWLVTIDRSILTEGLRSRIVKELNDLAAGSTLDPNRFEVRYQPDEVAVSGAASLPVPGICGTSAEVTFSVRNPTRLCRRGDGTPAIVSYPDIQFSSGNVCFAVGMFIRSFNVGTVSGPPVGEWPQIARVSFAVGAEETLYGTKLDLDNTFSLIGRSSFMDQRAVAAGDPRSPAAEKCPGVP